MCHNIGRPPIVTIGLGRRSLSSEIREPRPPARITALVMSPRPCSSVRYAHLWKRHYQLRAQSPRAQLLGDGLGVVPGKQYDPVRLLGDEAFVVDDRDPLAWQISSKLQRRWLLG